MPTYGIPQSGYSATSGLNLTSVVPGDSFTLFDGTETPASGLKSVAFSRGYSPGASDNGISFDCSGMPSGSVIDIQAANQDLDASYSSVSGGLTPDANGNATYTDVGRSAFYRAVLTTYTTGAMSKVIAQR